MLCYKKDHKGWAPSAIPASGLFLVFSHGRCLSFCSASFLFASYYLKLEEVSNLEPRLKKLKPVKAAASASAIGTVLDIIDKISVPSYKMLPQVIDWETLQRPHVSHVVYFFPQKRIQLLHVGDIENRPEERFPRPWYEMLNLLVRRAYSAETASASSIDR